MHKVVVAAGTRPEFIKLDPVGQALEDVGIDTYFWNSGQSPDLVDEWPNGIIYWERGLPAGISQTLIEFKHGLESHDEAVDAVIVQGDTATAFACALSAFLQEIPVAHVEAGLRTYKKEPYPEEAFRQMISSMATWHFAPDEASVDNLLKEGIHTRSIYVTGNPIIDTLSSDPLRIFCTLHRRENWGERTQKALNALTETVRASEGHLQATVVRHPNWEAQTMEPPPTHAGFSYIEPIEDHDEFIEQLRAADLIVTDSGGLQEEAAHFGVPCIVYRTATERVSLLKHGMVEIASPDDEGSLRAAIDLFVGGRRAYGHGDAGVKIARILKEQLDSCKGLRRPKPRRTSSLFMEYD